MSVEHSAEVKLENILKLADIELIVIVRATLRSNLRSKAIQDWEMVLSG